MKSRPPAILLICFFSILSCSETKKPIPQVIPEFKAVLDAHGDWSKWINAKGMSYAMIHETNLTLENHFINLESRKTRIDGSMFQIGFDGDSVWISPNRESFEGNSVRFYHNLYFYFYSIPYVFTDPGVTVEKVADRTLNGKIYNTLQAKMAEGIGQSSQDQYFMLVDPTTKMIEYLLYTVTYFDNPNPTLSALKYEDYRDAAGMKFPRVLTGYTLENDSTKGIRYQVSFGDVLLQDEEFEESLFEKPKGAVFAN